MSLKVFISGYGPFMTVVNNPSDELAKQLEKDFARAFDGVNIDLVERVTLPVTVPAVEALMVDWRAKIDKLTAEDPNNRFLCIHIGVNGNISSNHIEFERFSNNRRIMDDEGALYDDGPDERIVSDKYPANHIQETNFDIEKIVDSVSRYNPWAKINYDPGDYLCNFIYLKSVEALQDDRTNSFFLHIPDNWNWFHFEKETVFQFMLRYAGLYHPRLCFVTEDRWNLSEGENVDPLVCTKKIETEINKDKFPGQTLGAEQSKTKGTLTVKLGTLQLMAEGVGSVNCYMSLEPSTKDSDRECFCNGNYQNMDFEGHEITMVLVTGKEKFELAIGIDSFSHGYEEGKILCGFKKDVSVLMNEGTMDVEFELVDENEKWGVFGMEVTYEKSWC